MNHSVATLLIIFVGLPGCSLFGAKPPDVQIIERPTMIVCDTSGRPDALDLKDTPPTLVMNAAETWGYWFDSELYAALAENLQAMRTYMTQSRAVRRKLVACIEDHNEAIKSPTSDQ